jgi:hypothetical protein
VDGRDPHLFGNMEDGPQHDPAPSAGSSMPERPRGECDSGTRSAGSLIAFAGQYGQALRSSVAPAIRSISRMNCSARGLQPIRCI